ncbi:MULTISPECIES: RNA polymerase sigma factor [unclassified Nocardioides]|jgi:RNA polymerase sigma-70 factor (ECF subfamily)|uniref:RNA polymerase sigma factor n=1 Tax=unclassified Nocardioides TaxID=2615069 RepID=UPI0021B426D4|nr:MULTISPECIES: sigma-70 family RNA polymerase sigma factor [unclassified Nocardioides]WGY04767.1 sigma-70 family RNA polymerase sigma factor [Nocardioides sp. QY071]
MVEALMDGTEQAEDIDALYAASYRRLVVQMYAICGDLTDAEDAVQDAFITAIRKRRTLRSVDNPEAWIRTVALRRLHRGWRHLAVVRRHQALDRGPEPAVAVGPEHVALVSALALLDPAQREVVVLHHLADLSVAEIAEQLQVPEGTVKSRLGRGRQRLGVLLTDKEEPSHG